MRELVSKARLGELLAYENHIIFDTKNNRICIIRDIKYEKVEKKRTVLYFITRMNAEVYDSLEEKKYVHPFIGWYVRYGDVHTQRNDWLELKKQIQSLGYIYTPIKTEEEDE